MAKVALDAEQVALIQIDEQQARVVGTVPKAPGQPVKIDIELPSGARIQLSGKARASIRAQNGFEITVRWINVTRDQRTGLKAMIDAARVP
ncbi:MAG: hypothetical protein R3A47_10280 [Polyangiales bacterium]